MSRILKIASAAIIAGFLIRALVAEGIYPASESMEPTLFKGEHYLLEKVSVKFGSVKHGDIVVFPSPVKANHDLIKRVIAVGGDVLEIRNKKVILNAVPMQEPYVQFIRKNELLQGDNLGPLTVPENKLFVMGDNRDVSGDSRDWLDQKTGEHLYFVDNDSIKGKILLLF